MYNYLLIDNINSIDIIAFNEKKKQHYILDVIETDDEFYPLCFEMLDGEPMVYRMSFTFRSWKDAKKHYDAVRKNGFQPDSKKFYF